MSVPTPQGDDGRLGRAAARTVLLVEDEAVTRIWMASVIRDNGYLCIEADDGELGLCIASDLLPDVIVMDVQMPGMSGIEVSTRLRNQRRTAHIPTLFVSASGDLETRIAAFASGALQFADKPIDGRELIVRLEALIALAEWHRHPS